MTAKPVSKPAAKPAAKAAPAPVKAYPTSSGQAAVVERENRRKRKTGVVTSDKMQKTCVVRVSHKFLDPEYGKVVERSVKFKVHDEKNDAKTGDLVEIEETRPLSKDKRWRLVAVLEKGRFAAEEANNA